MEILQNCLKNSDLSHKSPLFPSKSNKKTSKSDPFVFYLFLFACLQFFSVSTLVNSA